MKKLFDLLQKRLILSVYLYLCAYISNSFSFISKRKMSRERAIALVKVELPESVLSLLDSVL